MTEVGRKVKFKLGRLYCFLEREKARGSLPPNLAKEETQWGVGGDTVWGAWAVQR